VSGNDSPRAGEPPGLTSTGLHLAITTVGAAVVIAVEGELDLQTVPQLVDAVAAAEATDLTVVIDLSRVTFLGSAAMGVLVDLGGPVDPRIKLTRRGEAMCQVRHAGIGSTRTEGGAGCLHGTGHGRETVRQMRWRFGAGKNLDEWIPRTYVQMKYTYGFVEKVADVKHDRSNASLEIGTFVTPRWNIAAYGWWQWTHGGVEVPMPPSDPLFPYHDRLAADQYFNVGLGTGWSFTPTVTAFATYSEGVSGRNGHRVNQGVTFGVSYGFRPRAEAVGVAKQ
jgi:hypothetical protein